MNITKLIADKQRSLTSTQIIVLFFLAVILVGAFLLNLPLSSRSHQSSGFYKALFTATSATCVAGFSLGDIWTDWSPFGQTVIMILINKIIICAWKFFLGISHPVITGYFQRNCIRSF